MDLLLRAGGEGVGPAAKWPLSLDNPSLALHSGLTLWQSQAVTPLKTRSRLARHGPLQESSSSS